MPERKQATDDDPFESTYPRYEFSELVRLSLVLASAWARWRGPTPLRALRQIYPSKTAHPQPDPALGRGCGPTALTPP